MPRRRMPHPREEFADQFRRAQIERDRSMPRERYGRAGFGYSDGYHGSYADRPGYATPRGVLRRPRPGGSSWPERPAELSRESHERHQRALADRDLARSVDMALYQTIGREADRIAVYANDGVITLEGRGVHPAAAHEALETAWHTPGVDRVRDALR